TMCHWADYHWLGVRTDPAAPKHRGISLFIVDLKSPGITVRELRTLHERTNEVFYDNVRVPKKNLVGEMNRGWYYIATALDYERNWEVGEAKSLFEDLVAFAKETKRNGKPLSQDPLVRSKLAELAIELEITDLLAWRVAWMQVHEVIPNYEAAMVKVFGSETDRRMAYAGMDILGLHCQLQKGSRYAPLEGFAEQWFRDSIRHVITRGTSEVMRNIVALRGLGLPRG
ncbi:MAG: acyl-CoA dehydrogenase family protein, partial [Chloroflexota bacterium]|nr:acyl-CoA dehydrogenase family protein [Chloroflexota bacterium]